MSKHEPIGYVIFDSETKAIDWDGDMHATREAAIDSLTGPDRMWCNSVEDEDEDRTYWGKAYTIGAVYSADDPADAPMRSPMPRHHPFRSPTMIPKELVSELEYDIFKAEEHGGDWKFLNEENKERTHKTALHLVLEGWTK